MSNSSIGNRIQELLDQLQTANHLRSDDPLSRVPETQFISTRTRPAPILNMNMERLPRNFAPLPFQQRNIDPTDTDNKLREIMKISGTLTISGVKYSTDISEMEHLGELGNGTCGQVVKMKHKPSGAIIAVKQMRRSGNNEENKRIIMDIDVVLKSHDCPYIVQCLGCFITDSDVWICMELMATCFDKLLKRLKGAIPEDVLRKVTYATVKALSYLKEQHDVIHRDVKPSNILVDERGNVKLCDFGISGRLVDSMAKTRSAGCAAYMAPERIEPPNPSQPDYDIRADVWSLGITLVELATGIFPYKDCKTDFEVLTKVLSEDPPSLPREGFSDEFRAFVACCLIKNYLDRPKYVKLLEQPFLKRYDPSNVDVDEWFKNALKQADLLGANSPGRRYTPAPTNFSARRHMVAAPQLSNGGAVGPPTGDRLPPDGRAPRHSFRGARSPEKPAGRWSPHDLPTGGSTAATSPYQQRRCERLVSDGFWQSPLSSPLPVRKHYAPVPPPPTVAAAAAEPHSSNTSPILLQRFFHQQKQFAHQVVGGGTVHQDVDSTVNTSAKEDGVAKKRFASHIKLQLVGDRCALKASRHQSPEPPPRLSRGSSTESSFTANNQSPLAMRRNFLDASGANSPSLSRRYISPSPPQPPPRRLSESSSVPGSPQHFRARFHYTPEPQRRVFNNSDIS